MPEPEHLTQSTLDAITSFYRQSSDFNGIPFRLLAKQLPATHTGLLGSVAQLIRENKVSAVFGDRHPNPHVRALSDEPIESQLQKLQHVSADDEFCLYPTTAVLRDLVDRSVYEATPFTLKLALGEPQLSFYAFDLSVLEFYRNDPRYDYWHDDISGKIGIVDHYYESGSMSERDQVFLQTFGFAYDANLDRAVAVFLRYLAHLTPEHQQIWHAKIVGTSPAYKLHPQYYRTSILGQWAECISIFDAFTQELHAINDMCNRIGWSPLFRNDFSEDRRPREFGFLIRPTVKEFNDFVLLLDKMISENLNHDFFAGAVDLVEEEERGDGKIVIHQKGTIRLLEEWLRKRFRTPDMEPINGMIAAFKEVRQLRQRPAHAADENAFDKAIFQRQRELMIRVCDGVRTLRLVFTSHPSVGNYEVSSSIRDGKIWTY